MIHIIRRRASKRQAIEMLEVFGTFIKLAVDVHREVLAGGGELHADCEQALLSDGSEQTNIWGADWDPINQRVTFEALINIRPRQNNRKMEIQDPALRSQIERIVKDLLGGVEYA
jgi:hypothetical protein